jgi:hypothetical protein
MAPPASTITTEIEQQLSDLRAKKQLQPVASQDEGVPLGVLPDLIYGFTYSPLNESTPLFAKRLFQTFEVHKLTDGVVHLIGFVKDDEAKAIFEGSAGMDVNLYPEPRNESARLVEIPLERVIKARPVSRSDGNYMPLHLDPA